MSDAIFIRDYAPTDQAALIRLVQELQRFEAPFFVPPSKDVPDGITLRVVAADPASGNLSLGQAKFPVLSERLPPKLPR